MHKAVFLLVFLTAVSETYSQEKATWTATPASVYQKDKVYPSDVNVRIFLNACYDKTGKVNDPLEASDDYSILPTGIGVTAETPTVGDCSLTTKLSISDSAQPGLQMLTVKRGDADMGYAMFALMDSTAGPIPAAPQVDVLWEVLVDHLCKDNFGNHMPSDLYCIEVKIGNNSGHSLQLAGIGFTRKSPMCKSRGRLAPCTDDPNLNISTPNVSYQTARASAQAGQSTTGRNILVNGTQAIGLLMASFTPFFRNDFNKGRWATGSAIIGTSLAQAINLVAPDQTIRELNNLDDQAFRDGKLIPNNTQVRILVFVQRKSVAEAIGEIVPQIKGANEIDCSGPVPLGYRKDKSRDGKCHPKWEDDFKDCISKLRCNPLIVKLALGRLIIVGDQIEYIQRVVVDSSVTSQEVVPETHRAVTAELAPVSPGLLPDHGLVKSSVVIIGSGFGEKQGKVTFNKVEAPITEWTDSKITVTVPDQATTGDVVVSVGGKDTVIGTFTVESKPQ